MSLARYHARGRAELGSILLPDKQLAQIDSMRRDTLERAEALGHKVQGAMIAGAVITAVSTAALVASALRMRKARA